MCQWDVVHGRLRYYKRTNATLNLAAQLNIPANSLRVKIRISANDPSGSQAYVYDLQTWTAANLGQETAILLGPYQPMVSFRVEEDGQIVTGAWTIVSLTSGMKVSVIETLTNEQFKED